MEIAIIGCGVMGSALARHFSKRHKVYLFDRNAHKASALAQEIGALCAPTLRAACEKNIVLCIKPKDFDQFVKDLDVSLQGKLLVSILAGISMEKLRSSFPGAHIVRSMPNLALSYGEGVQGLTGDHLESVDHMMEGMGLNLWISEAQLEGLTALCGSGIAFVLLLIEAFVAAGIYLGFPAQSATALVMQTFKGALALMEGSGKHPAELQAEICSPGGTTIEGLRMMEKCGVRSGVIETLIACYKKGHG